MTYLDSNIFIYAIGNKLAKGEESRNILQKIVSGEIEAQTCTLTWDEFIYVVRKNFGRELSVIEGKKFLNFPSLNWIIVDKKTVDKAQELIEKYNLKPRDAIHAASAIINKIPTIITDDSDFDKIKELKRIHPENFKV